MFIMLQNDDLMVLHQIDRFTFWRAPEMSISGVQKPPKWGFRLNPGKRRKRFKVEFRVFRNAFSPWFFALAY